MDSFQRLDADGLPVKETNPNIWDLYMREAKVHDTAMVERWKTAMEGLLIFAGLFSAAVTAFIIESYQMLQPDTGDITVDLLYQLTQQMSAIANGTQFSPSALLPPPSQTPFSPGFPAIATNVLWFISLGLSLACAVAATLVQQWARNYIHAIERRPSAERRARMRMYLFTGVESFKMSQLIDGVPALLHLALFSFFLGLIFFIQPISTPLTAISIAILVVCVVIYLFATFLPLFAFDSPIQTPLTSIVWQKKIIRTLYKTCAYSSLAAALILDPVWTILDLLVRQMTSSLQARLKPPSNTLLQWIALLELPPDLVDRWSSRHIEFQALDSIRSSIANYRFNSHFQQRETSAFEWLIDCLDEYNELLPFIEAIPNFLSQRLFLPDYDPRLTFSIAVQQPERACEFHNRLNLFIRTHYRTTRAVSAYVDFFLCLTKQDWTNLNKALDPDLCENLHGYIAQYVYSRAKKFPPDLRVRIYCLWGISQSFWNPRTFFVEPFQENPAWPARYLNLWRTLVKHCDLLAARQPGSTSAIHVHDAHLVLSQVMLNIVQDLTPINCQAFITFLDNNAHWFDALHVCSPLSCSKRLLPQEEQHLYCATVSLVVSVLDTEYQHEVSHRMAATLRKLFHLLCHISEPSSLKTVNGLLQRPIWTKHWGWESEFLLIVEALADRRDEEGQVYLSSDVMAKYHILKIFVSCRRFAANISNVDVDGPLFRGNTVLQDLLLQHSKNSLIFLAGFRLEEDPETGIEKLVLFFESVLQAFYFFDDHEMLKQALRVVNDFLVGYPYNEQALECKIFLTKRIAETEYEDRGVQALIKPEQGVQANL